ncbi:Bug family tripartite tricarboxylate transporter substrate binding protein [Falsiroseomonas sp.]|uniref:Bug family tripartite tricarboxylate transporter substrate binding protein n=1 Tax=Falsiroseomonas sp. TaxID=2870721 RepID=UPI003F6F425A
MTTRRMVLAAAAAALAAPAVQAQAAYPSRPIRFVVPWAPGGATGNIARIIGDAMVPFLGQPLVYDFRAGAGGAIGSDNVAKSAGDGYSILIAGAGTFYRPVIERDTPFDPFKDFGFIGRIGDGPFALVTRNGLPTDLVGFIAHGKANAGRMNYGSSGQGSTSHLTAEAFNTAAGIQATHIPYRGSAGVTADLIAGRIDYYFDAFSSVQENVAAGRIQILGVTSSQRATQAPEVPTIGEAALSGFSVAPWWGIVGPASVPAAVTAKLAEAMKQAAAIPTVVAQLGAQGCRAAFLEPAPFADFVRSEDAKWTRIIEGAGLRVA